MAGKRAVASGIANVPHLMAYLDAFSMTMAEVDLSIVLVQFADFAPAEALPLLAQQYDVLGVRGYQFCNTDEQRRGLLREAARLKRIAGTPEAIEVAIVAIGFDNAIVSEQTGVFYDGVYNYDGSQVYGGQEWYNLDVEIFYSGPLPSAGDQLLIRQLANIYKSERSVILNLKFTLTI
jgi:hypothetical protein